MAGLVAAQFPQWADRPVVRIASTGTDNVMFRLGGDLVVRLPRTAGMAWQVDTEQRWLPHVAPHLPLPVPVPLGRGVPDERFPLPWSVFGWLDGDNALDAPLAGRRDAARVLGGFVTALRGVEATGAPRSFRGGPLLARDTDVRAAIRDLAADATVDGDAATGAWEAALAAAPWVGAPTWLHGDLMPGNLLTRDGRLTAVIDFGGLGTGDPAGDLIPAWYVFDDAGRDVFRAAADVDDATWARGRGWALCLGLGAAHQFRDTNPVLAAAGRRAVSQVLARGSDC
ncbi:aminoglycoside phosphotransferase family protein [Dactylosporangium sp. NBC_01737]|uniref:aminoglycoside phosphotransferase family protein n=1 Tax=Dactylosporangium sp. NBC_01737 TaxID=2975959 RepID=UPI002E0D5B7E|nr:aminoglycoside phosphotransferase family protein [Dactylosporangium sp. NBC_01737]